MRGRSINPLVELADGEYERLKKVARQLDNPTLINIRMIERRLKLKAGQLANYRANHYSR